MSALKTATIIIHQLRTAPVARKKLKDIKMDLRELDSEDLELILNELDQHRASLLAEGNDVLAQLLDDLITEVRLGTTDAEDRVVPKQF